MIEAIPETGRQHQIRIHLAAIDCPVIGDKLYGPDPALMLEYIETGWSEELAEKLELEHHALHAAALTFPHPRNDVPMTIEAPLPTELVSFWQRR